MGLGFHKKFIRGSGDERRGLGDDRGDMEMLEDS